MIDESRALMIKDGEDLLRLQLIQQEHLFNNLCIQFSSTRWGEEQKAENWSLKFGALTL